MTSSMKAKLRLLFSAVMWGLNFYFLKIMLSEVSFVEAAFWRYLFAVLVLIGYNRKSLPDWASFKANRRGVLIVGLLGLFCFNLIFFWGVNHTTIVNAALILSLSPVCTLVLSTLLLKSRIRKVDVLAMLLGLAGVLYLLSKGDFLHITQSSFSKGDLLIIISMLLASLYHIWIQKYGSVNNIQHFTLFTNLVCLIAFITIVPYFITSWSLAYSGKFWLTTLLFGVVGTAITYDLWNKGVQVLGAGKAVPFMNFVPLSTALISALTGSGLVHFQIVSGVFILSGLLLTQYKTRLLH